LKIIFVLVSVLVNRTFIIFVSVSISIHENITDLHCVTGEALSVKSVEELQESAAHLALKYNNDINGAEILSEILRLKVLNFNVQQP